MSWDSGDAYLNKLAAERAAALAYDLEGVTAADLADIAADEAACRAARHHQPQTVYVGIGHPNHANNSPAPVFLSATTLMRYKSRGEDWPIVQNGHGWAGDSGAFTAFVPPKGREVNPNHPWHMGAEDYGALWARLADDIIGPDFIATQDWPCEPACRAVSGKSARWHADASIENWAFLAEEFYFLPWLRPLQGWEVADYDYAERRYAKFGIDLYDGHLVGLGSICRRGSDKDIAELVERYTGRGMRLHGFGVSIDGLRRIGHLLASTDSQAWSKTARLEHIRLPGCEHLHRDGTPSDCRNCFTYALAYREEMLDAIRFSANAQRRYAKPAPPHTSAVRTLPQTALFDRELVAA